MMNNNHSNNYMLDKYYKDIDNIKSFSDFSSILSTGVSQISNLDKFILFILENDKLIDKKDNISIDINPKEKSIITMAIKSHFPVTINDVNNSFIYNSLIDNPLKLNISNMMVVPLLCNGIEDDISYIVVLYRAEPFIKRDKEFIKKFLHKANNIALDKHQNIICEHREAQRGENNKSLLTLQDSIKRQQEFFSSTIHDIRTPINSVMGFLELLKLEEEDLGRKEYLDLAFKSSETITTLINDVLDISKIEAGKLDINIQFVSIINEFEDLSRLFSHLTDKKNINFIVCYDPIIPYIIRTDINRIKQIIGNLLSNAIKFTPLNGFIEFKIEYNKSQDKLIISVQDNGIGISKEAQEHIFTPFGQASKTTSSDYGGTGLGLSISKRLVELLGGELKLESSEGKGSKFYFEIPCDSIPYTPETIDASRFKDISINIFLPTNIAEEKRYNIICKYFKRLDIKYNILKSNNLDILKEKEREREVFILLNFNNNIDINCDNIKKRVILLNDMSFNKKFIDVPNISVIHPPIKLSSLFDNIENNIILYDKIESIKSANRICKILIIDDNMINLKLMREIIKKLGHKPYLLDAGREVKDILAKDKMDMIFVDQHMPDIDGDEVIKLIKEDELSKDTVIYGLTGSTDKEITDKMIDAGAISVLTKPIHIDTIVKAIERLILSDKP